MNCLVIACILTLDIHGFSYHFSDEHFNEVNPGLGLTLYQDNKFYMAGWFLNSGEHNSIYAGAGIEKGPFGLFAGLISGYGYIEGINNITPIIMPRVKKGPFVMYVLPSISDDIPATLIFSTSWKLK
jgi:hypothetical protein